MSTDEPLNLSMLRKCAIRVADRPDMSAKCHCFWWTSFHIFGIKLFCFVVAICAICDLVHDVEDTMHHYWLITARGNLFLNMIDARETSFASLIFQK